MSLSVYGITNCDTVRKARKWLEQHQITYRFHDVRVEPVASTTLSTWLQQLGADALVNKRSTSWRELTSAQQQSVKQGDNAAIVALLQQYPTLMKRPLLAQEDRYLTGFNSTAWQQFLELTP
ncbi:MULTISPECIES: ArsC family reductase [Pseudidiomarina]|uniref:Spx/MgsR family transcriptional regulator n=3 Tax=Pseudidiomarina TaxID=2800384 RepID=A0A368UZN4_9GAMM|nr:MULTISPECIES: ArsC family reductase [Pseudidiomarina]MDX1525293.1 ArsC family reductase [Pseudidiomarina maritima]PWW14402.1 Spx/MgsR family transcriptional regulator [Pseudidiomarina maritima]RBP92598.1 Spx/MgsR family transcriptional regulator [Pseudidiomarina tainanensis]RCW34407.1 Spx/MgsR family transcriptional regulator [Pseudidiomarina tainanensis]